MEPTINESIDKESKNKISPEIQALADLAGKMGELNIDVEEKNDDWDKKGINKKTGTIWDEEGYGVDGFDEDGVDREGFDRFGFGTDGRDRDGFDERGYDKEGYDRSGYNRNGRDKEGYDKRGFKINDYRNAYIHKVTGTSRDGEGFDIYGYDKEGYDREGFDKKGFDREKYKRDGYDAKGFNRSGNDRYTGKPYNRMGYDKLGFYPDGAHKDTKTNLDSHGFNKDGIHAITNSNYDEYGFNARGINIKTGRDRDENGFDIDGYDRFKRDREGYNKRGFDANGFDAEGYRKSGYDKKGFDRDGYNRDGLDSDGYNRDGLDEDGNTREFNAKFNKYGVDENGYHKNGEMDSDVVFAIEFVESGTKDQNAYASEKKMDEKEVKQKIELARKKCPHIDEIVSNLLATGNKMRMAAISDECIKFLGGTLSFNEFWDKHPKLTPSDVISNFINSIDKKKAFADKTIESIVMDSENIENNLQAFGTGRFDVQGAIKGLEDFGRIYTRFGTDGSQEQIQQKRENTKKVYDITKYLNKYKNNNMNTLLGMRISKDEGQTWIEFSGENIGKAMDELKRNGKLICVQSVRDYIIKNS